MVKKLFQRQRSECDGWPEGVDQKISFKLKGLTVQIPTTKGGQKTSNSEGTHLTRNTLRTQLPTKSPSPPLSSPIPFSSRISRGFLPGQRWPVPVWNPLSTHELLRKATFHVFHLFPHKIFKHIIFAQVKLISWTLVATRILLSFRPRFALFFTKETAHWGFFFFVNLFASGTPLPHFTSDVHITQNAAFSQTSNGTLANWISKKKGNVVFCARCETGLVHTNWCEFWCESWNSRYQFSWVCKNGNTHAHH